MIYTSVEKICEVLKKDKLCFFRVFYNGDMQYKQDQKMNPEEAGGILQEVIETFGPDSSGTIQVKTYETSAKDSATGKGGNISAINTFNVKVGESKFPKGNIQGFAGNGVRERELEAQLEAMRTRCEEYKDKIKEYELDARIQKMVDPLKKKIAGFEEERENDGGGLKDLVEMIKPFAPQLMGKFFGAPVQSPALNDNVSEQRLSTEEIEFMNGQAGPVEKLRQYELHEKIDSAAEELEEIFGAEKVAELLSILVEKARVDPVKFETYFPLLKSL